MSTTIIAGSLRGRKIKIISLKKEGFRPILARIKKSFFDIIKNRIAGSGFLDLYAGSGTVGIEAVSRGAESVVFVDSDAEFRKQIEYNLKVLGIEDRGRVIVADILSGLEFLKNRQGVFDIIFMGPPYKEMLVNKTIENILKAGILSESGIIAAQHHKKESIGSFEGLCLYRQEKYGDSVMSFFRASSGTTAA